MFGSDRKTDGVGLDTLIGKLFFTELAVRCGGGVDYEALYVCHIGEQGEDLQIIDKFVRLGCGAFDLKGEDRSAAVGEVFLIKGVIRMIGQGGMVDLLDLPDGSREIPRPSLCFPHGAPDGGIGFRFPVREGKPQREKSQRRCRGGEWRVCK